jgi:hypothetical protein
MKPKRIAILSSLFLAGSAAAAEITVFKQPRFAGEALTLRGDANNLGDRGFTDQISSVVVKSGQWQVCSQPDFKGDCVTLASGEYPTLDQRLNHRIESVREVTRSADVNRSGGERYANGYSSGPQRGYSRGPAVEVFTGPEFRGRSAQVDRDVASLDQGAASLVIREGTWQLCSLPGYEGVCRVFEPGEYETLGRLNRRIASLRRIG